MSEDDWIAALRPGDTVVVKSPAYDMLSVHKVASRGRDGRVSVHYGHGLLHFNPTGTERGGTAFYRRHLCAYTEAMIAHIAEKQSRERLYALLSRIKPMHLRALTLTQCEELLEMLRKLGLEMNEERG